MAGTMSFSPPAGFRDSVHRALANGEVVASTYQVRDEIARTDDGCVFEARDMLLDRAWDDEFLESFLSTERWGTDNVSFPGACYVQYIEQLYRGNALIHGGFTLAGRTAELHQIKCPTLALAFEDDHIVPLPAASPLVDRVAATDKQLVVQRGGHVGAVVSKKAADRLWPVMAQFWAKRD